MPNTGPFEDHPDLYEEWFVRNDYVYKSEIEAINSLMPVFKKGIEIGAGSGRFAVPFNIKIGLEPSENMGYLAKKRGIKIVKGVAEKMPFEDESFDMVLMVTTLCFLDDAYKAFLEVYRVLEKGGHFICGFVDKDSFLGKLYQEKKDKSIFYKTAIFYSVSQVNKLLKASGFSDYRYSQTIFKPIQEIDKKEEVREGTGTGSFVAIRSVKGL